MLVNQYPFLDPTGITINAEVCAKKLEGSHGIYAAPIADFISHLFHQNGQLKLTQYWTEIASLVRLREDDRYKESALSAD